MPIFILFLLLFIMVAIFALLIPSIWNLIVFAFNKIFNRAKIMDNKPHSNHQVRYLLLEDSHFQDETLYRLKKG